MQLTPSAAPAASISPVAWALRSRGARRRKGAGRDYTAGIINMARYPLSVRSDGGADRRAGSGAAEPENTGQWKARDDPRDDQRRIRNRPLPHERYHVAVPYPAAGHRIADGDSRSGKGRDRGPGRDNTWRGDVSNGLPILHARWRRSKMQDVA